MGYDYDELYPGRFLKSGEFKGKDATLTITDISLEELEGGKGKRARGIIGFRETKKQLVLNRTNGECLKGMFGRKTDDWIGKRVTLYPSTVEAFGAPTLAIRVRGSPDLSADKQIVCKVGRQGDVRVTMKATGKKQAKPAAQPESAPARRMEIHDVPVTTDGEPPPDVELPGSDIPFGLE